MKRKNLTKENSQTSIKKNLGNIDFDKYMVDEDIDDLIQFDTLSKKANEENLSSSIKKGIFYIYCLFK